MEPKGRSGGRPPRPKEPTSPYDDNVVRIVRQVGFDVPVIAPADFSTVRQAARTLASPTYRSLVIEKKE